VSPKQDADYWVEVKNSQGCVFRDTFRIMVHENPKITEIKHYPADKKIEVFPIGLDKYIFSMKGEVKPSSSNLFNYANYIEEDKVINIRVLNEWLCKDTADFKITPNMPDAFTPNGDGKNDKLLPGWHITVFDRTQKILYDGSDGWDGTYNGREMPVGTYCYVLYGLSNEVEYKGPVTILRESIKK